MDKNEYPEWFQKMIETKDLPESIDSIPGLKRFNYHEWWSEGFTCDDEEVNAFRLRDEYIEHFGFPFLTKEVMSEIDSLLKENNIHKILEVGAGSGFLSYCIQKYCNAECIATDTNDWAEHFAKELWKEPFVPIKKMDACEAIRTYHSDIDMILMSWPCYQDPMAFHVLQMATAYKIPILYEGEWDGGCCADDEFFELVREGDYSTIGVIHSYDTWYWLHDSFTLIKHL